MSYEQDNDTTELRAEARAEALAAVVRLIQAEVKKLRKSDIILSERETAENNRVALALEQLISRIQAANVYS